MNILSNLSKNEQLLLVGIASTILIVLILIIVLLLIKLKKSTEEVFVPKSLEKEKIEEKTFETPNKFDIKTTANMIGENLESKDGDDVTKYELEQEERSVISYEELKKLAQEQKETEVKVVSFDNKDKNDIKELSFNTEVLDFSDEINESKFKPSEFVSPVNGIERKDLNGDILDIENLDNSIKNSSEFLEALKELKKSLD